MKKEKSKDKNKEGKKTKEIVWQAPEYEYYRKDVSWYWISFLIAILLLAFAFWQKNFLFAVFVIIVWFVFVYFASLFPAIWKFNISVKGIEISSSNKKGKKNFYPYGDICGFDIHPASEEHSELILKLEAKFSPYLKINIFNKDQEKIEKFLLKFLPKEEYNKSLIDSLSHLIKF